MLDISYMLDIALVMLFIRLLLLQSCYLTQIISIIVKLLKWIVHPRKMF